MFVIVKAIACNGPDPDVVTAVVSNSLRSPSHVTNKSTVISLGCYMAHLTPNNPAARQTNVWLPSCTGP